MVWLMTDDVTGRKPMEDELRRAHDELAAAIRSLRAILDNIPDIAWLKDGESRFIAVNESFGRACGFAPDTLVGKTDLDVWPRDLAEKYRADDREVIRAGKTIRVEEPLGDASGGTTWIETIKTPIVDERGAVIGTTGIARDITERKRMEDELRRAHDELEARVEERTAALRESQEQLAQAQKMEAIGQLAGGVAHDFNNLLTIITGYSELILGRLGADDPHRAAVADIRQAGERAAALTRQLLAFSRKQILEPRILDLNDIVAGTEKILRRLIGEDIDLTCTLSPDLHRVKVDPGQMEQVILNLAVNARDAMPRGGRLTIETRNAERTASPSPATSPGEAARSVLLSVGDTGGGMTPEIKSRIFEPFFTTKGPGKGTGLGLSTVYGIVQQSGGRIAVRSDPGAGTEFEIMLPACDEAPAAPVRSDARLRAVPHGSETILLVEDEEAVRRIVKLVLESSGYEVLVANGGREALEVADAHRGRIHLLITDVVMPEMSGREVADLLRSRVPSLGVLFISGYTDDAVMRHGIADTGEAFLQKPFSPLSLAKKVRDVLDGPAIVA